VINLETGAVRVDPRECREIARLHNPFDDRCFSLESRAGDRPWTWLVHDTCFSPASRMLELQSSRDAQDVRAATAVDSYFVRYA